MTMRFFLHFDFTVFFLNAKHSIACCPGNSRSIEIQKNGPRLKIKIKSFLHLLVLYKYINTACKLTSTLMSLLTME